MFVYLFLFLLFLIPAGVNAFLEYLGEDNSAADSGEDQESNEDFSLQRTMTNAWTSTYSQCRKLNEKEACIRQKKLIEAQKYRMGRQLNQIDSQVNAVPQNANMLAGLQQ